MMKVLWINEHPANQRPKKGEEQKSKDSTKHETTLCATCKRNFKTSRGLIQHQKKCRPNENTNNITIHNVTVQPSTEIKIWGNLSIMDLQQVVSSTYEEAIKWKRNLFMLPSRKAGKEYIDECTRLILDWVNDSPLQSIAIKALIIMPLLLLQKCSKNSKAQDHTESLKRRLKLWKEGDFDGLVREVRFIQSKLIYQNSPTSIELMAKKFNNFMLSGKVHAALRLLSDTENARILLTSKQAVDLLKEKHPVGAPKYDHILLHGPEELYEEYAYEEINGALIYKIAREIKGVAGPSNLDANVWRRILTSSPFGDNSRDLCSAIALMAKKSCLKRYCGNDGSLEAFLACKLIPLDKNPEVRPIGIGEVIRRILGRAVMTIFILESAGDLQLCAGQRGM